MSVQEKAALEEQCAQLRLQAQAEVGQATHSEQQIDAAAQAVLLEQRTAELQVAEQRSQNAALEVLTLLATVARHKEEVTVVFTPQIQDVFGTFPWGGTIQGEVSGSCQKEHSNLFMMLSLWAGAD